jgi:hypothetical protein
MTHRQRVDHMLERNRTSPPPAATRERLMFP